MSSGLNSINNQSNENLQTNLNDSNRSQTVKKVIKTVGIALAVVVVVTLIVAGATALYMKLSMGGVSLAHLKTLLATLGKKITGVLNATHDVTNGEIFGIVVSIPAGVVTIYLLTKCYRSYAEKKAQRLEEAFNQTSEFLRRCHDEEQIKCIVSEMNGEMHRGFLSENEAFVSALSFVYQCNDDEKRQQLMNIIQPKLESFDRVNKLNYINSFISTCTEQNQFEGMMAAIENPQSQNLISSDHRFARVIDIIKNECTEVSHHYILNAIRDRVQQLENEQFANLDRCIDNLGIENVNEYVIERQVRERVEQEMQRQTTEADQEEALDLNQLGVSDTRRTVDLSDVVNLSNLFGTQNNTIPAENPGTTSAGDDLLNLDDLTIRN